MVTPSLMHIRKSRERGLSDYGWLQSYHTFSFSGYQDPAHMGFRSLRVINDDTVAPGEGFDAHPHRDMEIITYVLKGGLRHEDSMGNVTVLSAGHMQHISAGCGITHSERNASTEEPVRFLQMWIQPLTRAGGDPYYSDLAVDKLLQRGRWFQVAGGSKVPHTMVIRQDAGLFVARADAGQTLAYELAPDRGVWLHVIEGVVEVQGQVLEAGDALGIEGSSTIEVSVQQTFHGLLFDLPPVDSART